MKETDEGNKKADEGKKKVDEGNKVGEYEKMYSWHETNKSYRPSYHLLSLLTIAVDEFLSLPHPTREKNKLCKILNHFILVNCHISE